MRRSTIGLLLTLAGCTGTATLEETSPPSSTLEAEQRSRCGTRRTAPCPVVPDAGPAPVVDAGTAPVVDAGTPPVVDAGTPPVVDAGTPPVVDAGTVSPLNLDAPLIPGSPGSVSLTFTIRSDQARHPISPLIYGTNQPTNAAVNRYGLLRKGGNRLTAYNWENNASNAGSDYNYQNDGYLSSSATPGAAEKVTLDAARAIGGTALLTIPIVDYVAADKLGGGDVRNSGANYLDTRFKRNRATSGATPTATPDTTDAYVNQDDFITWLEATRAGAPVIISLDNEPDLWFDTHPEVHPAPVTYAELVSRTLTYATMIKKVAPTMPVTGFVSYGFGGYVDLQSAPDAAGKPEFIDYFLTQVHAAELTAGHRLVDYLDLHWYPEAKGPAGRITGTNITTDQVTARVQAPRSLWDPTYTESSWVASYLGAPVQLIPRLKAQIADYNPGTLLAFTEWNYGAGDDISGGVATADVLGIFGREGVGLASLWKLNGTEAYNDAALRLFRNFDGSGGAFGDTSLQASTSDVVSTSIYASVDAANPARTVLVALNKTTTTKTAGLTLAHPTAYTRLAVYTLTAAGGAQPVHAADVLATATNAFRYDLPPMSVSVLVPMP